MIRNTMWLKNGWDALNELKTRNLKNTDVDDFNCGGYGLNVFGWYCPYDTEEQSYKYFGGGRTLAMSDDMVAEETTEMMLKHFNGKLRRIETLDDIREDEYGVLYKVGSSDFHFIKYFPESKRFFHKPGSWSIRRISKDEAMADVWHGSAVTYRSKTIFFAMKK